MRWLTVVQWGIVGAMFVVAAIVWPLVPDSLPVHFGITGEANRYGSKVEGLLILPIVTLVVVVLLNLLPRIDPRRERYADFGIPIGLFVVAVEVFLALVYATMLAVFLGVNVNATMVIVPLVGLLLIAIGTVLGFVAGVAIGWSRLAYYWGHPLLRFIGPVPATAWLPVAVFVFPTSFSASAFLIALATGMPVAVLTWSGVASVNSRYYDVARVLDGNSRFLIFKVAIPAAMPHVFVGLFMGLSFSFAILVVAEMLVGSIASEKVIVRSAPTGTSVASDTGESDTIVGAVSGAGVLKLQVAE